MLALSLLTAAFVAPALVEAQRPPFRNPFYFSNPIQLDGKKCVTPAGGSAVVGATLVISDCVSSAAQKISWVNQSVRSGGLCWTAKSGNNTVSLATCNSADGNQSWYFNKFGGRQVKHNPTGLCLNLASAITTNNNPVQLLACEKVAKQIWNPYWPINELPAKVAEESAGQSGTNQCGTGSSSSAKCQNLWLNDINDWCLFAPPTVGNVGDMEPNVVSYCLRSGRGTRTIPDGTLKGVHFIKTKEYIQINAVGDFTKVNIPNGDYGGELDPHGATAAGNPVGGLVYGNVHGNNIQYHEWSSFISYREFCIRACLGPTAQKDCPHIYDVMGCYWNQPGNYNSGVFESCNGDKTLPAGIYGTSTWFQGVSPTPSAHPAAPSSQCAFQSTVKVQPLGSTTTPTPPGEPTGTPGTGKVIRSKTNTNKCVAAASNVRGAAIVIQDCTGAANQLFQRSGNEYRVYGFCLDVRGGSTANGTALQTWSCGGTNANQQFTNPANDASHITWIGRGMALDMTKSNYANGTPLQLWASSGTTANPAQIWTY